MIKAIRSWRVRCCLGVLLGLSTILMLLLLQYVYVWLPKSRTLTRLEYGVSSLDSYARSCESMMRDSQGEYSEFWRNNVGDFERGKRMVVDAIDCADLEWFETPLPVMCKIVQHPKATKEEPEKEPRLCYLFYWFELGASVRGVFFRSSDGREQSEVAPAFCAVWDPGDPALRDAIGGIYPRTATSEADCGTQNSGAPPLVFTQDDLRDLEIQAGLILADGTRTSTIPVRVFPSAIAPLEPHDSTQEHEAETRSAPETRDARSTSDIGGVHELSQ